VKRSPDQAVLEKLNIARWRARTDLLFLCNEILGYKDVSREVHGGLLDRLQKFPSPPDRETRWKHDKFVNGQWVYTPLVPMPKLEGKRRLLILDARGHLKTTINAQAHVIQWIINYPDCAILIVQSTADKAESILGEIKRHFQGNPRFRQLFPEHCPQKRIFDWGTQSAFTTEARPKSCTRKEPTVMAVGIETGSAGYHFDVIKFSDIVEQKNSKDPNMCRVIADNFFMMHNLLVSPNYWIDVEGTRYHFADVYGIILETEWKSVPEERRSWNFFVRSCFKRNVPGGQKFTPDELEKPFLLDPNGKRIPWWPYDSSGNPRFTLESLEQLERQNPYIFACQQLNNPAVSGASYFPVNDKYPVKVTRDIFERKIKIAYYDIAVDTAESDSQNSNYSSIVVGAWSGYGKCYIVEIVHGRFMPDKLIEVILTTASKYRRYLNSIKMEKVPFVKGLMAGLRRHMDLTGFYPTIELIQRDTRTSKIERIINTLQPWYTSGDLVFLDDLGIEDETERSRVWSHLLKELEQFPLSRTDDILDSLSDLFQNKLWFGREIARPTIEHVRDERTRKFLGTEDPFSEDPFGTNETGIDPWLTSTGGL
jgi:predicted phage terminase large subunit-like protein